MGLLGCQLVHFTQPDHGPAPCKEFLHPEYTFPAAGCSATGGSAQLVLLRFPLRVEERHFVEHARSPRPASPCDLGQYGRWLVDTSSQKHEGAEAWYQAYPCIGDLFPGVLLQGPLGHHTVV